MELTSSSHVGHLVYKKLNKKKTFIWTVFFTYLIYRITVLITTEHNREILTEMLCFIVELFLQKAV